MTNMDKLAIMLEEANVPFEITTQLLFNTPQICVPCADQRICAGDVVCNKISFGGNIGLLEARGFDIDSEDGTLGYMTAQETAKLIIDWWSWVVEKSRKGGRD